MLSRSLDPSAVSALSQRYAEPYSNAHVCRSHEQRACTFGVGDQLMTLSPRRPGITPTKCQTSTSSHVTTEPPNISSRSALPQSNQHEIVPMRQQRCFHDDFPFKLGLASVASRLGASSCCYFEPDGFSRIALPDEFPYGKMAILVLGSHITPSSTQIRQFLRQCRLEQWAKDSIPGCRDCFFPRH